MPLGLTQADLVTLASLIPLAPLAGAIVAALTGPRLLRGATHWPVILGVLVAMIAGAALFAVVRELPDDAYTKTRTLYDWITPSPGLWFSVSFCIDPLTAIMLLTVCAVSFLVIIYSRDYMREHGHAERGYERFFAFLGLFVFSMCTLVLAGNFLLLYLGWEAVGLCSYLLIGFYYQRPSAAAAAKKAFLVNRIGDFGFGLGILFLYLWVSPFARPGTNPLDYAVVFDNLKNLDSTKCTIIAALLFCGAIGKSAQFPLHVWLPDAMEGPTPVSALIHAATMVTAGVYMVCRCGAIFTRSPGVMWVVAVLGALTALFAATIALAQYDMKRILAYSTISQLGYMFLGLGVYAADSAIFHLYTHAFFKALLFLGAGSVMHAMAGTIDIREFGGLRRLMPVTYATFLVGALALAGCPLLSGFFSKDEIIHAAFAWYPPLGVVGLMTALLTAFYTFRMVFLAFHGPLKVPEGVHAHESGSWMLIPLTVLALGAASAGYTGTHFAAGGFLGLFEPRGAFHGLLAPIVVPFSGVRDPAASDGHVLMYVSSAISLFGILGAYVLYVARRGWADAALLASPDFHEVLHDKYYIDELYHALIVDPLRRISLFLSTIDTFVIEGLVWLVSAVPRAAGFVLRTLQAGAVQGYGMTMMAGLVLILLIALWAGR